MFGENYLHLDSKLGCDDCNNSWLPLARLNLKTDILSLPLSVKFLFKQNDNLFDIGSYDGFDFAAEMVTSVEYGNYFGLKSTFTGCVENGPSSSSLFAGVTGEMRYAEGK
jgi:hypothetical protein